MAHESLKNSDSILVLGGRGLVGSAILNELKANRYCNVLYPDRHELNLTHQESVFSFFIKHKPSMVFMAAAKVGGILANATLGADFILENLQIQQNVFSAARRLKTPNLIFLGSSCIYPRLAPQPIKEESLLTSSLEPTNEHYAIAKIAGLKTVQAIRHQDGLNWISVMPTNLYGPNDNFDPQNSHVIPGLISRMYEAKKKSHAEFQIWGSGKPRREFLFVDDLAQACVLLMQRNENLPDYINVGSGADIEIGELARMIAQKIGYSGKLVFDLSKPDGTPQKLLDVSKITALGWKPQVSLDAGLDIVIESYLKRKE